MELIQILFSVFGIFNFVYFNRSKIYNKMSKSKVGLCIMAPIMVPYVIHGLIKLTRDHDFSVILDKCKEQKKLDEFS
jgi:hypothetical protein